VLTVGQFAAVIAMLQRSSLGVATTDAIARFGITAATLAAFSMVQLLVYAVLQVPVGVLIDQYGSKRLIVVGSLIMAGAQAMFGALYRRSGRRLATRRGIAMRCDQSAEECAAGQPQQHDGHQSSALFVRAVLGGQCEQRGGSTIHSQADQESQQDDLARGCRKRCDQREDAEESKGHHDRFLAPNLVSE
jgi:hypothetical protein